MAIDFLDVLEELKAHKKETEIWSFFSNTFITIEHEFSRNSRLTRKKLKYGLF